MPESTGDFTIFHDITPDQLATFTVSTLQDHVWFILAEVDADGRVRACCDHGVYFVIFRDLVNQTLSHFSFVR